MQIHFEKKTQSTSTATEIERDRDMRWGGGVMGLSIISTSSIQI